MHPAPSSSRIRFASPLRRFRIATLVALTACGGGGDPAGPPVVVNPPTVRGVTVTPSVATIRIGETQSLSAVVEVIISSPIQVGSFATGKQVCVGEVVRVTGTGAVAARLEECRFLLES